jgi:hypothetical protein
MSPSTDAADVVVIRPLALIARYKLQFVLPCLLGVVLGLIVVIIIISTEETLNDYA